MISDENDLSSTIEFHVMNYSNVSSIIRTQEKGKHKKKLTKMGFYTLKHKLAAPYESSPSNLS